MSLLRKFLSLDEVKKMAKNGDIRRIGSLAISVGTLNKDNELRSYGAALLDWLDKKRK